jgi:transposase
VIRIDAVWLAVEPLDMRAGTETALAHWVGACGVQLQPLVDALWAMLLERPVLHADETPVAMLKPGKGSTHRAYMWSDSSTQFDAAQAVVYDFAERLAAAHPMAFLEGWSGKLVCDDYSGYKGLFAQGVTEVGCVAHARRKFNDLWVNRQNALAEEALQLFGKLYDVEREARELSAGERARIRQRQSQPIAHKLREWLLLQRQKATDGTAMAKAIDYSLGRWKPLTRFLDDGALPIDNNWVEDRIRPIALGRWNWLFAGPLRAGKRAAGVMSLIQSARLNGHDPYRYLKDVLEGLPTQPASRIGELLPHTPQCTSRLKGVAVRGASVPVSPRGSVSSCCRKILQWSRRNAAFLR